jgi:uncharacterized protein (TIGR02246 family)
LNAQFFQDLTLVPAVKKPRIQDLTPLFIAALLGAQIHLQAQSGGALEEAAVRAVVDRYMDARERQDAAAIGALFTTDADQLNSAGDWRRGREAIVRGTLESSKRNAGTRRIVLKAVRFPAPGVAIADGDYQIGPAQTLWTTIVLTRQGEAWRIAAIRNSRLSAPAGN